MSRFARPAKDEIIEDSEPEREEQSIRRKAKRKLSSGREGKPQKDVSIRKRSPCHEVIVISDESDVILDGLEQLNDLNEQLGTAEPVLEQDEPFSWDLPPPILKAKFTDAPAKSRDPSPVTVRSTSASPQREESPEKPRKLPNFAQYAYTGSRASTLSVVSRPSVPILSRDTPEVTNPPPPPKPKTKAKASHRFTAFKDSELAPLRKCVSCELSWTLRKTVTQKMKHIQTCARKNKLEDDTVIALIRAELARTLEAKAQGGPSSNAPAAEVAVTLLENVVQVEPKKKGRRPKVVESVKQLADTRESILERARLLLQSQPSSSAQAIAGPSKAKAPPSVASLPPATQAFGESALAQKYQSKALPDPTQPPTRVPSPPRTQAFGESNLAKQFHVQASYSYPDHDSSPMYIPSPLAQRNQGSDPPVLLSPTPTSRRLQGDGDRDLVLGLGRERASLDNPVSVLSHPDSVNEAGPSHLPLARVSPGNVYLDALQRSERERLGTYSPRTVSSHDDGILHFEPEHNIEVERYDSALGSDYSEDEGAILHYEPDARGDVHSHSHSFSSRDSNSDSDSSLSSLGMPRPRVRRSSSPLIRDDMAVKPKGKGKGTTKKVVTGKKKRRASSLASGSGSEVDASSTLPPPPPPAILSPTKKVKGTTTRKPRSKRSATGDVDVDGPTETTSKTKSKGKGKAIQLTDDELFAKLRESILRDAELYLRVLRYEPVHFDVFLKLAGDTGVSDRGLKLRVRAFLDKQAIHFHGLDVSRSRTKKRRA